MNNALNINKYNVLVSLIFIYTLVLTAVVIFYDAKKSRIKQKPIVTRIIQKQFKSLNGEHIQLSKLAKQNLEYPYSYQHIETFYIKDESKQEILVKTFFKSKDSYNTPRVNCLKAIYTYYGKTVMTPIVCSTNFL